MTGQYLLGRSRRDLLEKRELHADHGDSQATIDKEVFWDSVAVDAMKHRTASPATATTRA